MATQRSCDKCRFYRPGTARYTLERYVRRADGRIRNGRKTSVSFSRKSAGGVDLCPPCFDEVGANKSRKQPCSVCGFRRAKADGTFDVTRYSLRMQVPTRRSADGKRRPKFCGDSIGGGYGAISLCDECWDRMARPNQRPELRGKTGPKQFRGRVTGDATA